VVHEMGIVLGGLEEPERVKTTGRRHVQAPLCTFGMKIVLLARIEGWLMGNGKSEWACMARVGVDFLGRELWLGWVRCSSPRPALGFCTLVLAIR
jgi:hypothetical protein